MPKLKVFRTAIGFHDALVAAPSRAAALRAWGADADLFARGAAEEITDPALTAEALARPGEVVRRSRGSVAEQLAALPPDAPKKGRAADGEPAPVERRTGADGGVAPGGRARAGGAKAKAASRSTPIPAPQPKPRPPRPDPAALDAAEDALTAAGKRHRAALADLSERERALARERRRAEGDQADEVERLTRERDAARRAYDAGMRAWRRAS